MAQPPLLSRRGNLLADTSSLRLLGQALKPGAGRMSPLRGWFGSVGAAIYFSVKSNSVWISSLTLTMSPITFTGWIPKSD